MLKEYFYKLLGSVNGMSKTIEKKVGIIKQVAEELINEEELVELLKKKKESNCL